MSVEVYDFCSDNVGGNATRVQPFALNVTQPADFGTLYSIAELQDLSEVAHRHGLRVHLDGARFVGRHDQEPAGMDLLVTTIERALA